MWYSGVSRLIILAQSLRGFRSGILCQFIKSMLESHSLKLITPLFIGPTDEWQSLRWDVHVGVEPVQQHFDVCVVDTALLLLLFHLICSFRFQHRIPLEEYHRC